MKESKAEKSMSLGPYYCKPLSGSPGIFPRKQTAVVHANQRRGNNSLWGWEILHYDLVAVYPGAFSARLQLLLIRNTSDASVLQITHFGAREEPKTLAYKNAVLIPPAYLNMNQ